MPHFMVVLIPYINLLNLSWIIKCLFFEEYGALKIKRILGTWNIAQSLL